MSEDENIEQSPEDRKTERRKEKVNENISQEQPIEQSEIKNPISEIPKSEIENMEVHHHPHVEKKSFKEYFLEFLMIFLAVTLGFFAENIRESIGDTNKEKQYVHSLYDDMYQDSVNITASLSFTRRQVQKIDSLIYIINQSSPDSNQINAAYFCARFATRTSHFEATDRTIQQLNNSGNFRLIKNDALADSIIDYEKIFIIYKDNYNTDKSERQYLYPFIATMFDANVFQIMVDSVNRIHRISGLHPLYTGDKKLNNQFIYYLHQIKSTLVAEKNDLLIILLQTSAIRNIIRENYNIQN